MVMCIDCSVECRASGCRKRLCRACVVKKGHFDESARNGYCSYGCESGRSGYSDADYSFY